MDHIRPHIFHRLLIAALCVFFLLSFFFVPADAAGNTARPSVNGRLHVEGTQLVDQSGETVQLKGVSTHGLTWYPEYINEDLFKRVAEDWDANLIRLAMYASVYCGEGREESYALMKKGIEAAAAADTYVLVDWHMLEKGDPNEEIEGAIDFFTKITEEYADCPNLLFEICNEPNGEAGWNDVMTYADVIIPLIRKNIPESVIVVGTPEYDQNLGDALLRPLPFDNILYSFHFYAASHREGLRGELESAVESGLPVFISECGLTESDGDGTIDFASAADWFTFLNDHKISYAVWSLSDKDESSAFFHPGFDPHGEIGEEDLTSTGSWVRELLRGKDPKTIPVKENVVEKSGLMKLCSAVMRSLGERGTSFLSSWPLFAAVSIGVIVLAALCSLIYRSSRKKKRMTYDDIVPSGGLKNTRVFPKVIVLFSAFLTGIYLSWRVVYSIPFSSGIIAVAANLLLLAVEILGLLESMVLYRNLLGMRDHPLPKIREDLWPEVDVFVATYNEPVSLLRKTLNGCVRMKYPDPSKVHIWLCDDNRRKEMRELAEEMGVGYFDRPDNEGAKAGNLNHALSLTSAPYIVTFDADMIPKSDFLLKTIPYFADAEEREAERKEEDRLHLGLLQTPQCFYDPDVFQYALYSENRAPNEQDFFYRTIEPSKTSTNSVIYGGSNTVLSRKAIEDIGGFYTASITEDFATGLLIESAGYVSLAIPEPLASGQTPHTFREHVKQRTRWGRGVIDTARKLKITGRKGLSLSQKVNYWSSVVYWYSPVKNFIYILSPLLYAVFAIPVFRCNWLELLVFWLPMYVFQDLSLRLNSNNAISMKWSGIYETGVMPHLFFPILQELSGISLSAFQVTDKSAQKGGHRSDIRSMRPFLILILLSLIGIVRIFLVFEKSQIVSILILLFWIIRNMYLLLMGVFLADGRDSDGETVRVRDAEIVTVKAGDTVYDGVTTLLTEHSVTVFLDEGHRLGLGIPVTVTITGKEKDVKLSGVVTGLTESRNSNARTQTIEILDLGEEELDYLALLYDRIPTLPQSLHRDFGVLSHLWQNIAHRIARTRL